ncbi:MAG: LysE family translocator [Clostridiaceae bacterium]
MENFLLILKAIFLGFITGFIFALPLGPAGIEAVKRTISDGFKKGFTVSIGTLTADLTYIILINLGLSKLLSSNKKTEALFWLISGFVLSFIGYNSIKKSKDKRSNTGIFKNSKIKSMPFLAGFIITFSNPLTASCWITLSGTVIRAWYYVGPLYYYLFIFSIILGMFAWMLLLNISALKGVKFLTPSSTKKTSQILIYSIFFIGLGFIFFGFTMFVKTFI